MRTVLGVAVLLLAGCQSPQSVQYPQYPPGPPSLQVVPANYYTRFRERTPAPRAGRGVERPRPMEPLASDLSEQIDDVQEQIRALRQELRSK